MSARPYPQAVEAERAILGGLLQAPGWLPKIADALLVEDFVRPEHGALYGMLQHRWDAELAIDLVTIPDAIAIEGEGRYGGVAYVVELPDHIPSTANLGHYAEIIARHAAMRRFLGQLDEWRDLAYTEEPAALFDRVVDTVRGFRRPGERHEARWFDEIMDAHLDEAERLHAAGRPEAISTGYSDIDYKLGGGFHENDLVILAARPSLGKTALAMNILLRAGHDLRKQGPEAGCVGMFSLEMAQSQTMDRWLATHTGLNMRLIRQPHMWQDEHWNTMLEARESTRGLPLIVDARPGLSLDQIRATATRWKQEHNLRLLVVDYLQLMATPFGQRTEGVGRNSSGLKQLAKDLGIPILALAQLNRKLEERKNKRPMLSDLKDSGDIEQDADVILFIHRPVVYNSKIAKELRREAQIIVAKQRQGETGMERLEWWGETQLFTKWPSLEDRRRAEDEKAAAKKAGRGLTDGSKPLDDGDDDQEVTKNGSDTDGVEGKADGSRRGDEGRAQDRRGPGGQAQLGLDVGGDDSG